MSFYKLEDDRDQLDVFADGEYEGTIVADDDGVKIFGPDGIEIDEDPDMWLEKRSPSFLWALAKLAWQFGIKTFRWVWCVTITNHSYDCIEKVV
ncbi:hypothetical protein BDV59DRAFT_205753 [Aspergillus ambiguus]|uniref:uncharacterized protein n=1 Tax=Aspergillus ambiguus TaxID=176160 RepID=UPI003CCCC19E